MTGIRFTPVYPAGTKINMACRGSPGDMNMTDTTTGAILQRDGRTYAVVTRMPAGIVTPDDLEKIAGTGRKFRVPVLKITSGQRIILAGLEPGDVPKVIDELGPLAKPETAPC